MKFLHKNIIYQTKNIVVDRFTQNSYFFIKKFHAYFYVIIKDIHTHIAPGLDAVLPQFEKLTSPLSISILTAPNAPDSLTSTASFFAAPAYPKRVKYSNLLN
ncbi:hypothetical protein [Persicobacter sp. CCB-QB2]|uniref:hypothetical protein n=1 Tax=Persicobacter sp. CCB-QB2 TaxID=1561025 RepID=UPI0012FB7A17|nr:hypothetical protein [Persicobacter sp. CCB-QB2]